MLRRTESPTPVAAGAAFGTRAFPARRRRSGRSAVSALRSVGLYPVLDRSWDRLLYCCGGAALLSFTVWWLFPQSEELAVFAWLMFLTSGPTSTFLPSASEPILMAFGKLYSPLVLALIGVTAIALVEWLNYRVFGTVLLARRAEKVRTARITRWLMRWFGVLPFPTVVFAAFTPVPFWLARCCAVIARYPMPRFILATAIGRFPRVWLIATVGSVLPVTSATILTVGFAAVLVAGAVGVARRRRTRAAAMPPDAGSLASRELPQGMRR